MTSVIVPAHNEERVIGRLLEALLAEAAPGEFDVVVVSNGSTDATSTIARQHTGVRVVEIPEASKHRALLVGDRSATGFPRLYVDADVELDTASARALVSALGEPGILAAAPERTMVLDGSSRLVRAYCRVWERLSAVQDGLYGRGVLAVSEAGFARIADRPDLLGDDIYLHSRFAPSERRIVRRSCSVVRMPRTLADLSRRRTRVAKGNVELAQRTGGGTDTTGATRAELCRLALHEPRLLPDIAVFVAVAISTRVRARWTRSGLWLRDEGSRG